MQVLRLFLPIALLLGITSCSSPACSAPTSSLSVSEATAERSVEPDPGLPSLNDLGKRRGGGGGGRGGGGRGRGGGSRGGGSSPPSYSSSSNAGGRTVKGSGTPRTYVSSSGSLYYRGGSADPFPALRKSPGGINPGSIEPGAAAAIFLGVWAYSVATYSYTNSVTFLNVTSQRNETLPALCLCQQYLVCGCEENRDQGYLNLIANEASSTSESSRVSIVNGATTLVINGTLANGTTSPGGKDPSSAGTLSAGGTPAQSLGVWLMAGAILWGLGLL